MLAALVAKGELPPVDERLPLEPRVAPPVEEIGRRYAARIAIEPGTTSPETAGARFTPTAVGWCRRRAATSTNELYRTRGGWSDGNPLTADDVIFVFEKRSEGFPASAGWSLDYHTVRFEMDEPYIG